MFSPTTWNTPQTVNVTAASDNTATDDTATISHSVTAGDAPYSATLVIDSVSVTVNDDETPGITSSETTRSLTEGHATDATKTYTLVLDAEPTSDVTVTVSSADSNAVAVDTDTDTNGDQNTLTFTAGDWNTAQTVTLTAKDDTDWADETVTITHTASQSGGEQEYQGLSGTLTANVDDDEPAPVLTLHLSNESIDESGSDNSTTITAQS